MAFPSSQPGHKRAPQVTRIGGSNISNAYTKLKLEKGLRDATRPDRTVVGDALTTVLEVPINISPLGRPPVAGISLGLRFRRNAHKAGPAWNYVRNRFAFRQQCGRAVREADRVIFRKHLPDDLDGIVLVLESTYNGYGEHFDVARADTVRSEELLAHRFLLDGPPDIQARATS